MMLLFIYAANIIVAGYIGLLSLFFKQKASETIFQNVYKSTDVIRLVGSLWLSIAILSVLGFFNPEVFIPVLLLQFLYKGLWLMIVALPCIYYKEPYPKGMAFFFLVWVIIIPIGISWRYLF
ncbi:MAG: hypothetical protein O9340_08255 [Cyclobacteriaceae bacterium]|jgi:hypothetical protein|nr:hypothetical protein [Cyclobacteriaceae bacterium]